MIIVFWSLSLIFLLMFFYFVMTIVKLKRAQINKRWGKVLTDNLILEELLIKDFEGKRVNCYLYKSTDFKDHEHQMPGMLIFPRHNKSYPYFEN